MAIDQEEGMPIETTSQFATVIQEHLELRRRNAALEHEMPLQKYMPDDPFENHPLFKTEEQARVEDTMDGVASIVDEPTGLDWAAVEDTFIGEADKAEKAEKTEKTEKAEKAEKKAGEDPAAGAPPEAEEVSEEGLWSRSRDFDWGD
jgi:hypothetical protein